MRAGRSLMAVKELSIVTPPLEFAGSSATPLPTLYPTYARGQAYLTSGDGQKAAAEFQKIIDHAGLTVNYLTGSLARLGLARAYARIGDTQKARQAYQDFLRLWKDADSDIPLLKEARAASAKIL